MSKQHKLIAIGVLAVIGLVHSLIENKQGTVGGFLRWSTTANAHSDGSTSYERWLEKYAYEVDSSLQGLPPILIDGMLERDANEPRGEKFRKARNEFFEAQAQEREKNKEQVLILVISLIALAVGLAFWIRRRNGIN